jgi:hypothetical protein
MSARTDDCAPVVPVPVPVPAAAVAAAAAASALLLLSLLEDMHTAASHAPPLNPTTTIHRPVTSRRRT